MIAAGIVGGLLLGAFALFFIIERWQPPRPPVTAADVNAAGDMWRTCCHLEIHAGHLIFVQCLKHQAEAAERAAAAAVEAADLDLWGAEMEGEWQ